MAHELNKNEWFFIQNMIYDLFMCCDMPLKTQTIAAIGLFPLQTVFFVMLGSCPSTYEYDLETGEYY